MRVRKRYAAASLAAALIVIGGLWIAFGVLTAPEWTPGMSWTYRVDDGHARWNVTFQVAGVVNLTSHDAWAVNVTTTRPGDAGATTRYFAVDTRDELTDPCAENGQTACWREEPLFDFPLVAGENWEWRRDRDDGVRVESHARVWMTEGRVEHAMADGARLTYEFTSGAPFFTTRTAVTPSGDVVNWWLAPS